MDFDALKAQLLRLHRGGEFREALALLDEREASLPNDAVTIDYWRACLLARAGDGCEAISVLQRAVDAGHWYSGDRLEAEDDLAAARSEPAFAKILRACVELEARARRAGPPSPLVLEPEAPADSPPALVAFHPAASSPHRFAQRWAQAARAGWEVVLPCASNPVASDSYVWLDRDLRALDTEAARRALRDGLPSVEAAAGAEISRPVILAGFGQGGAVALLVALQEAVRSPHVLLIGATARHAEAVDAMTGDPSASPPRVHALLGEEDPQLEATQQALERLRERSLEVSVDLRPGLGHEFPPDFAGDLRACLEVLARR